jgi:hypothetical protein
MFVGITPRPRLGREPAEVFRDHRDHHGRVKRRRRRGMHVERVLLFALAVRLANTPHMTSTITAPTTAPMSPCTFASMISADCLPQESGDECPGNAQKCRQDKARVQPSQGRRNESFAPFPLQPRESRLPHRSRSGVRWDRSGTDGL